jgi:hypothetical protein
MDYRGEPESLDLIRTLLVAGADPDRENHSGTSPRDMVQQCHANVPPNPEAWDLQPHLGW